MIEGVCAGGSPGRLLPSLERGESRIGWVTRGGGRGLQRLSGVCRLRRRFRGDARASCGNHASLDTRVRDYAEPATDGQYAGVRRRSVIVIGHVVHSRRTVWGECVDRGRQYSDFSPANKAEEYNSGLRTFVTQPVGRYDLPGAPARRMPRLPQQEWQITAPSAIGSSGLTPYK